MRVALVITTLGLGLVACVPPDEKGPPDGTPFGCQGQSPPVSSQITIAGTVVDPVNNTPASGATVALSLVGVTTPYATATTDSSGTFVYTQQTGGSTVNAFLRISRSGSVDTDFYPAAPIAQDFADDIQMFTVGELTNLGGGSIDMSKAQLLVLVQDCNGEPVGGATITTDPPGTTLYFGSAGPTAGLNMTDATTGAALVANLPATGNITVGAMLGSGMMFNSHVVSGRANALLETEVQP